MDMTDRMDSRTVQQKRDSLGSHRSHAQIMEQASRTSADIDAESITSPELTDLIKKKREELRDKPLHPTRDKPTGGEAIKRRFTRHRVPKMTQSHEATNKIMTSINSICTLLDQTKKVLELKQLREIASLVSFVNELYGKSYRNPVGPDQRTTAEIKAELVIYQKAADRLEQQERSLRTGGTLPKIDNTLAQRLEQQLTKRKEAKREVISPEERRKREFEALDKNFEALNASFKRRGDYLTDNLGLNQTYGDDLVEALRKLQSTAEETKKAANTNSTAASVEAFRSSVQALHQFHSDYTTATSKSSHITVKERRRTIESLQKREREARLKYKYEEGMLIGGYFDGKDIANDLNTHRDKIAMIEKEIEIEKRSRQAIDPEDATSYLKYEQLIEDLERTITLHEQKVADGKLLLTGDESDE